MCFLIGLQLKINVSYLCNHSVVSCSSVDVSNFSRHEGRTTFGYLEVAFRPTIA